MRISDWSSDVCSADRPHPHPHAAQDEELLPLRRHAQLLAQFQQLDQRVRAIEHPDLGTGHRLLDFAPPLVDQVGWREHQGAAVAFGVEHRSEEHTSELQSLMRISYAVFCLKKKKKYKTCIRIK